MPDDTDDDELGGPLVAHDSSGGFGAWVSQLAARRGVTLPHSAVRATSPRAAVQLAAAGLGVTIAPYSALTPLPAGIIRPLDPPELRDVIAIIAAPHDAMLRRFAYHLRKGGLPGPQLSAESITAGSTPDRQGVNPCSWHTVIPGEAIGSAAPAYSPFTSC